MKEEITKNDAEKTVSRTVTSTEETAHHDKDEAELRRLEEKSEGKSVVVVEEREYTETDSSAASKPKKMIAWL